MGSLSVAIPFSSSGPNFDLDRFSSEIERLAAQECVVRIILLHQGKGDEKIAEKLRQTISKLRVIFVESWISGKAMTNILAAADADAILLNLSGANIDFEDRSLEGFLTVAEISGGGLIYSNSRHFSDGDVIDKLRVNYTLGSIRNTFDFGPIVLISTQAAKEALRAHGNISNDIRWGGFYDLRLKISIDHSIVFIQEALYVERESLSRPSNCDTVFYEQNRNDREYHLEMEKVATDHLRRINAYLEPRPCPPPVLINKFPVTASIIIPTHNRERTIAGAIESALSQSTTFSSNIIIVDNHSADRTSEVVRRFAKRHKKIIHIIPTVEYHGIGGLWNEAIYSPWCGLYAVQLDSDDVYANDSAVESLINKFTNIDANNRRSAWENPRYAMVVGSYTTVNFDLVEVPPGLSQRPELTHENGQNNILCIEGPGAPRAFYVPVLRRLGFPNVSCGEDYAVTLRISREYSIGRIFEPIYLARQWENNTHRSLPLGNVRGINIRDIIPVGMDGQEFSSQLKPIIRPLMMATSNHVNVYKDYLRTIEIQARQFLCQHA